MFRSSLARSILLAVLGAVVFALVNFGWDWWQSRSVAKDFVEVFADRNESAEVVEGRNEPVMDWTASDRVVGLAHLTSTPHPLERRYYLAGNGRDVTDRILPVLEKSLESPILLGDLQYERPCAGSYWSGDDLKLPRGYFIRDGKVYLAVFETYTHRVTGIQGRCYSGLEAYSLPW